MKVYLKFYHGKIIFDLIEKSEVLKILICKNFATFNQTMSSLTTIFNFQTINQHTTQDDITGKEIETATVLEHAFNCLLKEFTTCVSFHNWRKILDSYEENGKFVIILPTYFSENAQQFAFEIAVKVIQKIYFIYNVNIIIIFKA